MNEKLLREYIRRVLQEDGGGDGGGYGAGDIAMDAAGMSPFGISFGSNEDLYKIFVKPFVDVIDTTVGKTKEVTTKAATVIKTAFVTVMTTLIPTLQSNYDGIFEHEQKELEKIKKEYGEVYQANLDAFRDNDVVWTAFCYAPAAYLTGQFIHKAPKAAVKVISALTGGELDTWLDKVRKKFWSEDRPHTGLDYVGTASMGGGNDMGIGMEGVIREDKKKKQGPDVASVLGNKKVLEKVASSSTCRNLQQATQTTVKKALSNVYRTAAGILGAKTLQDMQNKSGVKLKGLESLAQVPQQERQKAEQALLASAKKSVKELYSKNLEAMVSNALKGGVPDDSQFIGDVRGVIAKIKAL